MTPSKAAPDGGSGRDDKVGSAAVHIDEDRVAALAGTLDDTAPAAAKLGGNVNDAASEAADLGLPLGAAWFIGIPLLDGAAPGGKLTNIGQQAPDKAAEIRRRLEFLATCEQLQADGFEIDQSLVFEDANPPDALEIEYLADQINEHGLHKVFETHDVSRYAPAEIDAALASMPLGELLYMNTRLLREASPTERAEASSWLFSNISAAQIERLHDNGLHGFLQNPALEPDATDDVQAWVRAHNEWGLVYYYEFEGGASSTWSREWYNRHAVGRIDDTWLMAAMSAVETSNRNFMSDHIQHNPNGTFTVTLYQDGKPVDVTVSDYLPEPSYAARNWVAIYQKAAAQLYGNGSYGGLHGGTISDGLELVTGGESHTSEKPNFNELERKLDAGEPVIVNVRPWEEWQEEGVADVNHLYVVVDVIVNDDGERVARLRDPSGYSGFETEHRYEYLTEDDYNEYITEWHAPAPE